MDGVFDRAERRDQDHRGVGALVLQLADEAEPVDLGALEDSLRAALN